MTEQLPEKKLADRLEIQNAILAACETDGEFDAAKAERLFKEYQKKGELPEELESKPPDESAKGISKVEWQSWYTKLLLVPAQLSLTYPPPMPPSTRTASRASKARALDTLEASDP